MNIDDNLLMDDNDIFMKTLLLNVAKRTHEAEESKAVCDGTPREMFIGGYCTDLEPPERGCVGKEHCARFEDSDGWNIDQMISYLRSKGYKVEKDA